MNSQPAPFPVAAPPELRVLGYRLHPLTGDEVIAQIADAIAARRRLVMANLNLHGMAVMFDSPAMARLLSQDDAQVMIDGMPILAIANLFGAGLSRDKRATSLDFYDRMFALAVRQGWRIGYVGADPDVLARGMETLRQRFPGLDLDGRDGFFAIDDDAPGSKQAAIIDWLKERSHDMVIVGMGMPRQEAWIERVQHHVPTRVFVPTGAYLDYQIGVQKLPPRWMGRLGVEWAYRLLQSPQRLGYRYLVEPAVLAARLVLRSHPQGKRGQA